MKHSRQQLALVCYTAAIFLSALLLFSLQPLFTRLVLPRFGGASSVWAVSVFFYQSALLTGYALAHLMARRLSPFTSATVQLALLLLAIAALPIHLPAAWAEPPPGQSYLWLTGALVTGVGLPFLVLSINAPLLQAWFGSLRHPRSDDPYFLYAASNAGSLSALIAYPFLIEPLMTLQSQSRLWSFGFAAILPLIAACGAFIALARPQDEARTAETEPDVVSGGPPAWSARLVWAALAFIPSALVVAFTTFVTTDLASTPLLWTLPLALYLATFIVTFRRAQFISRQHLTMLQPFVVAASFVALEWLGDLSWLTGLIIATLAYLLTCLIAHGQLYALRPGKSHVTEFYLWISIGGVFGGLFAAIIAPLAFTEILEFQLLLALGLLCRPDVRALLSSPRTLAGIAAAACLMALIAAAISHELIPRRPETRFIVITLCAVAFLASSYWPRLQLLALSALVAGFLVIPRHHVPVHAVRTFHGAHRVVADDEGRRHLLFHGTTLHGAQTVRGADGKPVSDPVPQAYYQSGGALDFAIRLARSAGGPKSNLKVGVAGLGAGAMACHGRPGDRWTFFEIDPAIVEIATNPAYFSYLANCRPDAGIVLGDARLSLAKEPEGEFDFLLIDVFSSDAIPVHLMTVEALALYVSRLSERGLLALHISNLNLDLPPVVEANAALIPGLKGVYLEGGPGALAVDAQVVLLSRHADILLPAVTRAHGRPLGKPGVRAWTDDHASILSALGRQLRKRF